MSDMSDSGAMRACSEIEAEIDRRIAHQKRYGKGSAKSQAIIDELEQLKLFVQQRRTYYNDR